MSKASATFMVLSPIETAVNKFLSPRKNYANNCEWCPGKIRLPAAKLALGKNVKLKSLYVISAVSSVV